MLTITVATQDGRLVTLYLESDWKLSKLKELIKTNLDIPVANQQLLLDGKHLANTELTLDNCNIHNGDIVYVVYVPQTPPSLVGDAATAYADEGARQRATNLMESLPPGSTELEALRESAPGVYSAITSGDVDAVVAALREQRAQELQKLKDQQMRLLRAEMNPLDPDSQRIIQEAITQNRINESLINAQNYLPELLSKIVMLYVKVDINRIPVQALVDTGAEATVMSKECAERCNLIGMIDSRYKGVAVGVSKGNIIGKIHLANMKIGQVYVPFSVVIIDSVHIDFILGLDVLRRHQCTINLKDNVLHISGETIPFLAEREIKRPGQPVAAGTATYSNSPNTPSVSAPRLDSSTSRREVPYSNDVKELSETLGITEAEAKLLLDSTNGDIELAASLHYQQQYD